MELPTIPTEEFEKSKRAAQLAGVPLSSLPELFDQIKRDGHRFYIINTHEINGAWLVGDMETGRFGPDGCVPIGFGSEQMAVDFINMVTTLLGQRQDNIHILNPI